MESSLELPHRRNDPSFSGRGRELHREQDPSNSDLPLSSDQHAEAEPTSVSVEVAKSSVINSNTLDEIGPLAEDMENGSVTKQLNEKKNKEGDDPQDSAKFSSSSCSSIDQAQREGSSESEKSQGIKLHKNDISILSFAICFQRGNHF